MPVVLATHAMVETTGQLQVHANMPQQALVCYFGHSASLPDQGFAHGFLLVMHSTTGMGKTIRNTGSISDGVSYRYV